MMYVSTTALGLGLLKPSTIISQLRIKALVGHTRLLSETHRMVSILHETLQFQSGYSTSITNIQPQYVYWNRTWLDHTYHCLRVRGLQLQSNVWNFRTLSINATIMDLACQFTKKKTDLQRINLCRLYKKVIFPVELLTINGKIPTTTYIQNESVSQLHWVYFFNVTYPSTSCWRIWKRFLTWMRL